MSRGLAAEPTAEPPKTPSTRLYAIDAIHLHAGVLQEVRRQLIPSCSPPLRLSGGFVDSRLSFVVVVVWRCCSSRRLPRALPRPRTRAQVGRRGPPRRRASRAARLGLAASAATRSVPRSMPLSIPLSSDRAYLLVSYQAAKAATNYVTSGTQAAVHLTRWRSLRPGLGRTSRFLNNASPARA